MVVNNPLKGLAISWDKRGIGELFSLDSHGKNPLPPNGRPANPPSLRPSCPSTVVPRHAGTVPSESRELHQVEMSQVASPYS